MKINYQVAEPQGAGGILSPGPEVGSGLVGGAPKEGEPPAEGMRELDVAAGGGQVPIGPLGGPEPKTREELVVETNEAIIAQAEAEIAAVETPPEAPPPEDTTQGGLAGRVGGPLT